MKRTVSVFLVIVFILSLMTGCGKKNDGPVVSMDLPENGIVEKSVFDKAVKNNSVLFISGKSGEYKYQWAAFGNKIENSKDTGLSVNVSKTGVTEYHVALSENVEFYPTLSVRIPDAPSQATARVLDSGRNELEDASVSSYSTYSDVCFYVQPGITDYFFFFDVKLPVPENSGEKADENVSLSEDKSVTDAGEEGTETQDGYDAADYLKPVPSGDELKTASGKGKVSDGRQKGQDQYLTDPVPAGKPLPVEPQDQVIDSTVCTCTLSISCTTILNNMSACNPEKVELVPANGWILSPVTVTFNQGESVFDVLKRVVQQRGIHMELKWTPIYNSVYIEGINNLYEFDVGDLSGWMYKVNGWFPNYGCSRYQLQNGDTVEWVYTCDLGYDVGGGYAIGG